MHFRECPNIDSESGEEGFEQIPTISEEIIIYPSQHQGTFSPYNSIVPSRSNNKRRYLSQQKPNFKLKIMNPPSRYLKRSQNLKTNRQDNSEALYESEEEDNRLGLIVPRRLKKLNNNQSVEHFQESISSALIKTKRNCIAENLTIFNDVQQQNSLIKEELSLSPQGEVAYKQKIPDSTFNYFRRLLKNTHQSTFLGSKLNTVLKVKMEKVKKGKDDDSSFERPKKADSIEFSGDFESGNLDFALKVSQDEFNIFLRIDTNTRGHQSWFYFKVSNTYNETKKVRLNICNVKRRFRMIQKGQKIHFKDLALETQWQVLDQDIEVEPYGKRKFKISFDLTMKPQQQLLVSLIPPYTYSRLLRDIEEFEGSPHFKVEVLTHTITGLAIPLLTITKGAAKERKKKMAVKQKKKVILISGRIHPSETCSSYIIIGLIRELLREENIEEFLSDNIIKIVPMLNPDGVVFGNFRTNYLGDDLNRSFHRTDDTIFPETTALKQLGKSIKNDFGDNFVGFIDLHGHSSQTNSFVYGPEHEQKSESFVECRILPKIIDRISKYFKYEMSEFKLPDYKSNTARGYFLKKLKVPSYTIQTSYALYRDKEAVEDQPKTMSIPEWKQYGQEIAFSLFSYFKYLQATKPKIDIFRKPKDNKNRPVLNRKDQGSSSCIDFGVLRKQIEKQARKEKGRKGQGEESEDSDGESQEEDLPLKERELLVLKIREKTAPSFLLPKVSKPSMALPPVFPSISSLSKEENKSSSGMPRFANKFRPKKLVRPLNLSYEYTQYLLKNISDIGSLRPEVLQFSYGRNPGIETVMKKQTIVDL